MNSPLKFKPYHPQRTNWPDNLRIFLAEVERLPETEIWMGCDYQYNPSSTASSVVKPKYFRSRNPDRIACDIPALNERGLMWATYEGITGPWCFMPWMMVPKRSRNRECCPFVPCNYALAEFFGSYAGTEPAMKGIDWQYDEWHKHRDPYNFIFDMYQFHQNETMDPAKLNHGWSPHFLPRDWDYELTGGQRLQEGQHKDLLIARIKKALRYQEVRLTP